MLNRKTAHIGCRSALKNFPNDCFKPTVVNYSTQGAFVVDRLSILHISAVQRLTGATILSTFSMEISEESFGQLERIDHVVLNDKR